MKIPKITPRGKQILVKPEEESSRESDHGLLTPSNVEQDQKSIGEVIAVGKEIKDVKKGDRVIYAMYAGETLNFSSDPRRIDYKLLLDEDILAFIE